MIYKEITDEYAFWEWLKQSDSYSNNFSFEGAKALQAYIEELSNDIGEDVSFDPIAWCCEFSEYKTALEAAQEYGYEEVVNLEEHGSVDLLEVAKLEEEQAFEWLNDNTHVTEFDGGVIVRDF